MTGKHKRPLIVLAIIMLISLCTALLVLRDETGIDQMQGNTTPPIGADTAPAITPPRTTNDAGLMTAIETPVEAPDILRADTAATIADRASLLQMFRRLTGGAPAFQTMSDDDLYALLKHYEKAGAQGDAAASIQWLALAWGLCMEVSFTERSAYQTGMVETLLDVLPPDERQFTREFVTDYQQAEQQRLMNRQPWCKDMKDSGINSESGMVRHLSKNNSLLAFLLGSDRLSIEQISLLSAGDHAEIMRMSDDIRANIVQELLSQAEEADPCTSEKLLYSLVAQGTGPEILRVRAKLTELKCDNTLLSPTPPLEYYREAASFGDRTAINDYLSELAQTGDESFRVERAAWQDFMQQLARQFCYGNQTLNVLTAFYRTPQNQIDGLSAFESTQAHERSAQLTQQFQSRSMAYLGCVTASSDP